MSDQILSSLGRDPVAALEFGDWDIYNASFVLTFEGFLHTEYAISPARVMDEAATMHFDFVALADHHGDVTFHFGDTSNQPVMGRGLDSSELADPLVKNYNTLAELISSSSTEFGIAQLRDYGPEIYFNFVDEAPISTFVMYQNGEFFKPDGAELCTEYGTAVMIYDRNVTILGDTHTEMGLTPRAQTDPPIEFNFITTRVATSSALHLTFSGDRIVRLPGYEDSNFSLSAKKSREFVTTSGFTSTTYGVPRYTHEYGWLRLSLDFAYDWPGDNVPFYFGVSRGFVPFSISSATEVYSPTFIPDHVLDFDQDPHTEFGEWEIEDDRQHCNLIGAPSFVEFGEFGVGYRRHVELIGEPEFTQLSPVFIANYTRYLTLFSREAPPDDYGDTEFISRDQLLSLFGETLTDLQTETRFTTATIQEVELIQSAWANTLYGASDIAYTGPLHIALRGDVFTRTFLSFFYNADQYLDLRIPEDDPPYFTTYYNFHIYHLIPRFYTFGSEDPATAYDHNSISTDPHFIDFNPPAIDDPPFSIDGLEFYTATVGIDQYVGLLQDPPFLRMTNPRVIRHYEIGLRSFGTEGVHTIYGALELVPDPSISLASEFGSTGYDNLWVSYGKRFVGVDNAVESLVFPLFTSVFNLDQELDLTSDEPVEDMTSYGVLRLYNKTFIVTVRGNTHFSASWFDNTVRLRDKTLSYDWDAADVFGEGTFVAYARRYISPRNWGPLTETSRATYRLRDKRLGYEEQDFSVLGRPSIGYDHRVLVWAKTLTTYGRCLVGHTPRYLAAWGIEPPDPQLGSKTWVTHSPRAVHVGDFDAYLSIANYDLVIGHRPVPVAELRNRDPSTLFSRAYVHNKIQEIKLRGWFSDGIHTTAVLLYNQNQLFPIRSAGESFESSYAAYEITLDERDVDLRGFSTFVPPLHYMTRAFNELTIEDYTQLIHIKGENHTGLDPHEAGFTVRSMTVFLNGYEAMLNGSLSVFGGSVKFVQSYFLVRFGKMRVGTPADQWIMLDEGEDFDEVIEKSECPSGLPGLTIIPMHIELSSGTAPASACAGGNIGDFLTFNKDLNYPRGAFEIMTRDQTFFMYSDYPYYGTYTEMGISPKFYRRLEYVHLEGKHSLSRGPLEVWPYPQTSFQFGDDHLEFGEWRYEGGGLPPIGTNPFTVTVTMEGLLSEEFTYYVERFNRFVTLDEIPESLVFGDNHPWISYPRGFEVLGETHTIFEEEGFGYIDYGIRSVIIGDFESFEPIYYYNNEAQQPYGQYFFAPIQDDAGYGHFTIYTRDQKVFMFGAESGCPPQKITVNHV